MSDIIKKIKIKKQDGTFTDYIPIGAEAENINVDGESVKAKLNKMPYYYNNVADMKADESLKVGDMAITLGYYEVNDGGGAEYKIREITNEDIVDEMTIIALYDNTLIAELIIEDILYIEQLGAKNNTNSTTQLQKAINISNEKGVKITSKFKNTYLINSQLVNNNRVIIDFNGATIKANTSLENMLYNNNTSDTRESWNSIIKNLVLDGDSKANIGFNEHYNKWGFYENIQIINCLQYGLYVNNSHETTFNQFKIQNCDTALYNNSSDLHYSRFECRYCRICISNHEGNVIYDNFHAWIQDTEMLANSIFADLYAKAIFTNCYVDTYKIAYYMHSWRPLIINGGIWMHDKTTWTQELINEIGLPIFLKYDDMRHSATTIINGLNLINIDDSLDPPLFLPTTDYNNWNGYIGNNVVAKINIPSYIQKTLVSSNFDFKTIDSIAYDKLKKSYDNICNLNIVLIPKTTLSPGSYLNIVDSLPSFFRPTERLYFDGIIRNNEYSSTIDHCRVEIFPNGIFRIVSPIELTTDHNIFINTNYNTIYNNA